MTRAKDELDLIVPQRLYMHQHNGYDSGYAEASITRFIPKSIRHAFELRPWSERSTEPAIRQAGRINVAASIERMWQQANCDL